ncbi:MAG: hypothetical protein DDG60_12350 [Anaerolineae bacterium]|nr:MAG: hypothetical protein DDG60_12350 [Anaerolineae bacterium]
MRLKTSPCSPFSPARLGVTRPLRLVVQRLNSVCSCLHAVTPCLPAFSCKIERETDSKIRGMRANITLILLFLLTACATPAPAASTATFTPSPLPFFTATLPPTFTPRPSLTPAPPTLAPTFAPINGTTNAQVNVRSAPSSIANALGLLPVGTRVQVLGRDSTDQWLMVIYPPNSSTTGWVAANFIKLEEREIASLPVMQAAVPDSPATAPPDPSPTANPYFATIKTTINVRTGPASTFPSLGLIEAGKVVILNGRNQTNTWYRIYYPVGSQETGWVAAAYVDAPNLQGLPYYDNEGNLVYAPDQGNAPGQPTLTPTTFSPAAGDGDSEQNPAVRMEFSPAGAELFSYSSDLSSPTGDDTDWVAFVPYVPTSEAGYVYLRLDCQGNGGITATVRKEGRPLPDAPQLLCGQYRLALKVLGGQEYLLVLRADGSGGPLRYVSYTLTISLKP